MRRTTTLTALLLGAALLAPTGASAEGATCRGEAATIVGTGPAIVGTPARDVIVTGTSNTIDAGEGDDLVCVTVSNQMGNLVTLDAGPGNDVVDSTAMVPDAYLTAVLGAGADIFDGGVADDKVLTGTAVDHVQVGDAERDVVDTGAGDDDVATGQAGLANTDEVRLGDGIDITRWHGVMAAGGVLDGGLAPDSLWLEPVGTSFDLDLPAGTATADGVPQLGFSGFSTYLLRGEGARRIGVVGTSSADDVDFEATAVLDARLDSGNDVVEGLAPLAGSRIDLGAGQNVLALRAPEQRVDLDLEDELLRIDGKDVATVRGAKDAFVTARRVRIEGDRRGNDLSWRGCVGRLEGGGGRDALATTYDYRWETGYRCSRTRAVLVGGKGADSIRAKLFDTQIVGGAGNDELTGSSKDDVLVGGGGRDLLLGKNGDDVLAGGAGRDRAKGGPGRDRCSAEAETSCER